MVRLSAIVVNEGAMAKSGGTSRKNKKQPAKQLAPAQNSIDAKGVARQIRWIEPFLSLCGINLSSIYAICAAVVVFISGATMHWMGVFPAAVLFWLALVFLAVVANAQARVWRVLLSVAAVILLIVAGRWVVREYVQYRPVATVAELRRGYVENRTVYVSDIPYDDRKRRLIKNNTFDNCTIIGPAIVGPGSEGATSIISRCIVAVPPEGKGSLYYEIMPGRNQYAGVTSFDGITIRNSTIMDLGFLATKEHFQRLMMGLEFSAQKISLDDLE
jgi:hypothetical protein